MPGRVLKKLKHYENITGMSKLARRYFVMNTFDGTLTIFGILLGSFLAGLVDAHVIITLGLGAGAAIFVSGIWGTYLSESAERAKSRKDLERMMLKSLKETEISRAEHFASLYVSFVNGVSPLVAILIILSPFFLSLHLGMEIQSAYFISFALFLLIFVLLGVFLGRLSKKNLFHSAAKTLLVGLACALLIYGISMLTGAG